MIRTIPEHEWVTGQPMASVVMAAFCHPPPGGSRFSSEDRGAWYAARALGTALAESAFRRTQELREVGTFETRVEMRVYLADFRARFHDVRANKRAWSALYDPDDYTAGQALGRALLEDGSNGIVYRSVRDPGGECIACFRPALVRNVRSGGHYEFRWDGGPRRISARSGRKRIAANRALRYVSVTSMHPWHDCYVDDALVEAAFPVIIEVPNGSTNKYELDKETGLLRLDRVLYSAVHYPADYGFIPRTFCDDGDPLDALVLGQEPVHPLTIVEARAIGVMRMRDEKGIDDKIVAVSVRDPAFAHYTDKNQLPAAHVPPDPPVLRGLQGARAQAGRRRGPAGHGRRGPDHPRGARPLSAAEARRAGEAGARLNL